MISAVLHPWHHRRDLLPFFSDFEDTFVIDHMGYMKQSDGLTQADFDRFVVVLAGGHCYIKRSGPYRVAPGRPLSSVQPIGRALVTASPDRLLGSDWRISRTGSAIPANCSTSWSAGRPMTRIAVRSLSSPMRLFYMDLPGITVLAAPCAGSRRRACAWSVPLREFSVRMLCPLVADLGFAYSPHHGVPAGAGCVPGLRGRSGRHPDSGASACSASARSRIPSSIRRIIG
jgi:hypothetical protein